MVRLPFKIYFYCLPHSCHDKSGAVVFFQYCKNPFLDYYKPLCNLFFILQPLKLMNLLLQLNVLYFIVLAVPEAHRPHQRCPMLSLFFLPLPYPNYGRGHVSLRG